MSFSDHVCRSTRRVPIATVILSLLIFVFSAIALLAKKSTSSFDQGSLSQKVYGQYPQTHMWIALMIMQGSAVSFWLLVAKLGLPAPWTAGCMSVIIFAASEIMRDAALTADKILEQGKLPQWMDYVPALCLCISWFFLLFLYAFHRADKECSRCRLSTPSPWVTRLLIVILCLCLLTIPLHLTAPKQKMLRHVLPFPLMRSAIPVIVFILTSLFHAAMERAGFTAVWTAAFFNAFMFYLAREMRDAVKLGYYDADGFNIPLLGLLFSYAALEGAHGLALFWNREGGNKEERNVFYAATNLGHILPLAHLSATFA